MKVCNRCKNEKSLDEFSINRASNDGKHSVCKDCKRVRYQERAMSVVVSEKFCPDCKETKTSTEFPRQSASPDGLRSNCKKCRNKIRKDPSLYRDELNMSCRKCHRVLPSEAYFKNKHSKLGRERTCIECKRASRFQITRDAVHRIRVNQGGRCPCCSIVLPFHKECIDHNHRTGRVRGILCSKCNAALGLANDDVETLRNMILYIEEDNKHERQEHELLNRED